MNEEYEEKLYNVELVTEQGLYGDEVAYDILQLMFSADVVTVRRHSIIVEEIEVTDKGVTRFHGKLKEK
ncbi:hypothetical protein ACIP97_16230 [Peribacillus frigoritolerans]|uniref:hypothetical protein n=1 Tax=Peribacillus frigoritolerans TaxID=450367 RepID=UPI0038266CB9